MQLHFVLLSWLQDCEGYKLLIVSNFVKDRNEQGNLLGFYSSGINHGLWELEHSLVVSTPMKYSIYDNFLITIFFVPPMSIRASFSFQTIHKRVLPSVMSLYMYFAEQRVVWKPSKPEEVNEFTQALALEVEAVDQAWTAHLTVWDDVYLHSI